MNPKKRSEGGRILVVDDEVVVLDLFSEILALDGHRVFTARDARKALQLLTKEPVDVVISDFRMRNLSGEEFFNQATSLRPGLEEFFVFTSGEMDGETQRRFVEQTGVHVIAKPFKVDDVRSLVNRLIDAKRR
jgi:DNA-binding NtrC family response regulator